jgi:hypothetical protein
MFVGSQALKPLPHLFLSFKFLTTIFFLFRELSPTIPIAKVGNWGGAGRPARRSDDLICRKSLVPLCASCHPTPWNFLPHARFGSFSGANFHKL